MLLTRVAGRNFRLFESFELRPCPGLNLFAGPNAAGKTTLLEAIYLLARAQSFRSGPAELAGAAGKHWQVGGDFSAGPGQPDSPTRLAWSPGGLEVRIQNATATVQELVRRFAAQVLEPDSHRLLQDGPVYRRRYLDWGVFHVEHRFFPAWRRYQRALRQRNEALRAGAPEAEIQAWTPELAESGEAVHALRTAHLAALEAPLARTIGTLLPGLEWSLSLRGGWPDGEALATTLTEHLPKDRQHGSTTVGPHRAELRLKLAGRSAKHQVSRGQQKMLIAALLLAQAALIRDQRGEAPALLIDDFPAELGPAFQEALLACLRDYPGQVFLTAIEVAGALKSVPEHALFHVEHGTVSPALRV